MEYASGGELGKYVKHKHKLEEQEALDIFTQLLTAVQHCHALGVIHRDLKLENILFADSLKKTIKIVDFGIAGFIIDKVGDKSKAGSLKYIAPEILTEKSIEAKPSLDVWSMGCILYSMLCGCLPFTGKTSSEIISKIKTSSFDFPSTAELSAASKDLIKKMLAVDYKRRIVVEDIWKHPWVRGRCSGEYSQAFSPSAEQADGVGLNERRMAVRKRYLRPMSIRNSFRVGAADKNNWLGLPRINYYRTNGRVIRKRTSKAESEEFSNYKTQKKYYSPFFNNKIQDKIEQMNTKLTLFNEYENVPSFMQPIHHTREEKQIINSFAKDLKEIVLKRRAPKTASRRKYRARNKPTVERKKGAFSKLLLN
eukprot:TRINITY_DN3488_c0_g3_i5.p1 TRINITY_DN3488_c0_g3~~TRINITY_DN3488_c0_g3_i5.p1  ORF type:complete len:366 (+),score=75.92 TRINITY_DN3488_c0_g3_i5:725-1822(+)